MLGFHLAGGGRGARPVPAGRSAPDFTASVSRVISSPGAIVFAVFGWEFIFSPVCAGGRTSMG